MRATLALAVLLVPFPATAQTRSDGTLGSGDVAPTDFHTEALRSLASYRAQLANEPGGGAVRGTVTIGDAEALRVVGTHLGGTESNLRVLLAARDGTVVDLIVDDASDTVHLVGLENAGGTVRTPETLTGCTNVEPERIRVDCEGLRLDVRFVDDDSLSRRDRGWARAAAMIVVGDEVWDSRVRPTWVSDDGARAHFSVRTTSQDTSAWDGSWGTSPPSFVVDGEVVVTLGETLALEGEPTVAATRTLDCGPPYRGCCSPPPRICSVGPTIPFE